MRARKLSSRRASCCSTIAAQSSERRGRDKTAARLFRRARYFQSWPSAAIAIVIRSPRDSRAGSLPSVIESCNMDCSNENRRHYGGSPTSERKSDRPFFDQRGRVFGRDIRRQSTDRCGQFFELCEGRFFRRSDLSPRHPTLHDLRRWYDAVKDQPVEKTF